MPYGTELYVAIQTDMFWDSLSAHRQRTPEYVMYNHGPALDSDFNAPHLRHLE